MRQHSDSDDVIFRGRQRHRDSKHPTHNITHPNTPTQPFRSRPHAMHQTAERDASRAAMCVRKGHSDLGSSQHGRPGLRAKPEG
eukprot:28657-Rhodomonas_salina.3